LCIIFGVFFSVIALYDAEYEEQKKKEDKK